MERFKSASRFIFSIFNSEALLRAGVTVYKDIYSFVEMQKIRQFFAHAIGERIASNAIFFEL
jgi:hypothetical protein